ITDTARRSRSSTPSAMRDVPWQPAPTTTPPVPPVPVFEPPVPVDPPVPEPEPPAPPFWFTITLCPPSLHAASTAGTMTTNDLPPRPTFIVRAYCPKRTAARNDFRRPSYYGAKRPN